MRQSEGANFTHVHITSTSPKIQIKSVTQNPLHCFILYGIIMVPYGIIMVLYGIQIYGNAVSSNI